MFRKLWGREDGRMGGGVYDVLIIIYDGSLLAGNGGGWKVVV